MNYKKGDSVWFNICSDGSLRKGKIIEQKRGLFRLQYKVLYKVLSELRCKWASHKKIAGKAEKVEALDKVIIE